MGSIEATPRGGQGAVADEGEQCGEDAPTAVPSFDAFISARSASLLRSAYLLTGQVELAEDLLQTAWSKVWPRWNRLARRGDPEPYVRRVLYTTYASWWRRRWTSERPTEVMPEQVGPDDNALVDLRRELLAAMAQLSRMQRAVVVLRYFDDRTEAETAAMLGCSIGTVKSHMSRAMAHLRQSPLLAGSDPGEDPT